MNDPVNLPPPAFTPEQLAERWACEPDVIRRLCRKRKLGYFKVGHLTRIPRAAVEEYERQGELRERAAAPVANPCIPGSGPRLDEAFRRVAATRGLPARR